VADHPFRVPDWMRPGLEIIARLSDQDVAELRALLEKNPDVLFSRQAAAKHAGKLRQMPAQESQLLLETVVPLIYFMGAQGKSPQVLLQDIHEAVREMPADQYGRFSSNLSRILTDSSLVVAAKALSVATDCPRLFTESRIISDLRPIFGEQTSEPPSGAVITHTLRITYAEEGGEKEFFVYLDSRDLDELQGQIKRALDKDTTLRRLLQRTNLKVFETS
jgi:hypothetical protein